MDNEEKQLIRVVNVKYAYVWVGVGRVNEKKPTSNVVAFFKNSQNVQLTR
jgi:hypothetical protein